MYYTMPGGKMPQDSLKNYENLGKRAIMLSMYARQKQIFEYNNIAMKDIKVMALGALLEIHEMRQIGIQDSNMTIVDKDPEVIEQARKLGNLLPTYYVGEYQEAEKFLMKRQNIYSMDNNGALASKASFDLYTTPIFASYYYGDSLYGCIIGGTLNRTSKNHIKYYQDACTSKAFKTPQAKRFRNMIMTTRSNPKDELPTYWGVLAAMESQSKYAKELDMKLEFILPEVKSYTFPDKATHFAMASYGIKICHPKK